MSATTFLRVALLGASLALGACADAEESETSRAALSDRDLAMTLLPAVRGTATVWDVVALHDDSGFDGYLFFGRRTGDDAPDRLVAVDTRTGAVALSSDASAVGWDETRTELGVAGRRLLELAGEPASTVHLANTGRDGQRCALQLAVYALLAVGAVGVLAAVPFASATAGAAAIAARGAASAMASRGVATFAREAAARAWASPRVRKLMAFTVAKDGAKAWLLFSDAGQALTRRGVDEALAVFSARCSEDGEGDDLSSLIVAP